MKKFFFVAILFLSSFVGYSQLELLVQNSDKGLYLNHTVTAKETLYSLGRLYNLHPRDIAAYNNLDMNSGLNIGQTVRIPLKENFSQSSNKGIPVYYVVGEKEGLYRVSQNNNNVLMANLRQWNRLQVIIYL
jgi:murein DD-endopeptidase MepM/ murein hydrolase activator NlpD